MSPQISTGSATREVDPPLRLLDLYSCAGGAAMGYHRAGFEVVGVDIDRQRNYPFEHHVSDAIEFALSHGHEFDAIHASPPCQAYTVATAGNPAARAKHQRLIAATRDVLLGLGKPYIIENVYQAKSQMEDPVMLCGRMFDLRATDTDGAPLVLDRHRLFESNIPLSAPEHPRHGEEQVAGVYGGARRSSKPNATAADDRYAARHERKGGYVPRSKAVQQELLGGVDWMTVREMHESIPPAYTEHIGCQLIEHLTAQAKPQSSGLEQFGTAA